jgi:hypothetical protein
VLGLVILTVIGSAMAQSLGHAPFAASLRADVTNGVVAGDH